MSSSSSAAKIFRPWTSSVKDADATAPERADEIRNSAFARVPEPGHSAAEFTAMYENFWNAAPALGFDDWTGSLQMLPIQTPENLAQSLSYLDPAYLNMAFPEIYANTKITKMKQRPKKFRCPHCKVSFSNNGQLKGHVRIHTGECDWIMAGDLSNFENQGCRFSNCKPEFEIWGGGIYKILIS